MTGSRNLLVLYTGGTIGMYRGPDGLMPASGFEARMREQQAFEEGIPDWWFHELSPVIDSANMTQQHWLLMREVIVEAVVNGRCDGVLLLQGTDTLAYSAAALSFLLYGLPCPLLVTGSMLPAGEPGSDAWANLFGAMRQLAAGVVPGVHVFFHNRLLHGARCSKVSSDGLDAFQTLPRRRQAARARLPESLGYGCRRQSISLAVVPFYPGLMAEQVSALLDSGVRGLVLECFGSGTGPSEDAAFMAVLREAHERGVVLLAISQCPMGSVSLTEYAASSGLIDAGVISAGGMTREAALGKLFAVLGAGYSRDEAEYWLGLDWCGEMSDLD